LIVLQRSTPGGDTGFDIGDGPANSLHSCVFGMSSSVLKQNRKMPVRAGCGFGDSRFVLS
jgi:hypothetical protein